MARLLLLLMILIPNISCDRDEPEPSDIGEIIGTWEGNMQILTFTDGTITNWSGTCVELTLSFYEDGRLLYKDYVPDSVNVCIENTSREEFGEWNRLSNGKYVLILFNKDDSNTILTPDLITFEESNGDEIGKAMRYRFSGLPENAPENAAYLTQIFFKR